MKRTLYANVVRDENGKKKPYMGEVWGKLKRSDANTKCTRTGDGLMVLDIDTKKMKNVDKKLRSLLPKPTVETANGYHWYFEGDVAGVNQTQALFEHVDIRNEGGLVFSKYWGDDSSIWYHKIGGTHTLKGKLKKYLIKASQSRNIVKSERAAEVVVSGEAWDRIPDGEQHDGLRRRVEAGFKSGLGYDMVKAKYDEYLTTHLVHNSHEHKLRDGLLAHGLKCFGASLGGKTLDASDLVTPESESKKEALVWDGEKGVFVEFHQRGLRYHAQNTMKQTLRSKHSWDGADVNDFLGTVPLKYTKYYPDGRVVHDDEVNVYQGVEYKGGEIDLVLKVLDNLFIDQDGAKDRFINWLAYIIQTGKCSGVAWGFFGAAGSGKGLISELMMKMVGVRNTSFNVDDSALQSAFNDYAANVQFIHLNEIASDFHGRHGVAGKLKALVSDPMLNINQKNVKPYSVENFANVILNSNKAAPIELDPDDRRWNMIVSKQSLKKCAWWYQGAYDDAVAQWSAFGAWLMKYTVNVGDACSIMEMSEAKQRVIESTSSQVQLMVRYIDSLDDEGLLDFLQIEPADVLVNEIKNACKIGFFSSPLVVTLYRELMGNKDASARKAVNSMKPYLRTLSYGRKKIKGAYLRGFKNVANQGRLV